MCGSRQREGGGILGHWNFCPLNCYLCSGHLRGMYFMHVSLLFSHNDALLCPKAPRAATICPVFPMFLLCLNTTEYYREVSCYRSGWAKMLMLSQAVKQSTGSFQMSLPSPTDQSSSPAKWFSEVCYTISTPLPATPSQREHHQIDLCTSLHSSLQNNDMYTVYTGYKHVS